MLDRRAVLVICVCLVSLLAGCTGGFRAHVPASDLPAGWELVRSDEGGRWSGLGSSWTSHTYQADPGRSTLDSGPYPASFSVFSIVSARPPDRDSLLAGLDAQIVENAAQQDLAIDTSTRTQGERTTGQGLQTGFFYYRARVGSDSALFDAGQEARVMGEVWYDEPSGLVVLVVGLAQVQGGGATGRYFVDATTWADIVANPSGTIEGHAGTGLAYDVVSH